MKRRDFLKSLCVLAAPAFVKASSLWLPPERPRVQLPTTVELDAYSRQTLWVNPRTWAKLMLDEAELRRRFAPEAVGPVKIVQDSSIKCDTVFFWQTKVIA